MGRKWTSAKACSNVGGEINDKYSQSKKLQFIKRTSIVISEAAAFYTDANKLRKAGYKAETNKWCRALMF